MGTRAEIERAHKGRATTIVDLAGKTLVPAFLDPHSHYINALTMANQVNVFAPPAGPGKDAASIVAELKKFRDERKIPEGEVIMAYGYDETTCPAGSLDKDRRTTIIHSQFVRLDQLDKYVAFKFIPSFFKLRFIAKLFRPTAAKAVS